MLPEARPYLKDLPFLADSGYEGAGAGVLVPVKKPARGKLDIDTKTRRVYIPKPGAPAGEQRSLSFLPHPDRRWVAQCSVKIPSRFCHPVHSMMAYEHPIASLPHDRAESDP